MESVDDEQQPNLSSLEEDEEEEEAIRALPKSSSETITPNFIGLGKHRMAAAVDHLHHQIQIIQEELEELETLGESSLVCKELVSTVESIPDALLPLTQGPAVVGWDRWFQGAHGSRGRKWWF
ncbi:Guanine nucleotide-binding protein subunit gamma 1 like [Actinidia chinensis var. chinensis]|uniref:Guanine nucleotide-binding protein subunit gamma 1 like n=1 Tax=Actinidia chinensis var. chinensis TaxID=1590841 RepID=A0A2R6QMA4_ACTCC|nr:Guanine nucleotide-binding protein subunit gamma 1 like [Actinidia chinensis var. chinensis]